MFSLACKEFHTIGEIRQDYLQDSAAFEGEPVLVFWSRDDMWAVVSTREIVSVVGQTCSVILLDDIQKVVKIEAAKNDVDQATKLESEFLLLGPKGIRIWAPRGKEIFGLMNMLRMFPLGK